MGKIVINIFQTTVITAGDTVKTNVIGFRDNNSAYDIQ
jgi:hypothetical protein